MRRREEEIFYTKIDKLKKIKEEGKWRNEYIN